MQAGTPQAGVIGTDVGSVLAMLQDFNENHAATMIAEAYARYTAGKVCLPVVHNAHMRNAQKLCFAIY